MSLSSGFPNLPGFVSNKTKPAPRAQTFSVAGGLAVEKKRADEPEPDYTRALVERGLKARSVAPKVKADLAATKRDAPIAAAAVVPPHVLLARQVLRFNTYFQEAIHESALESFRYRRVDILYYLEDDSIQLIEGREENSGIPQGTMLKRHRIAKSVPTGAEEEYFTFRDLGIGNNISLYGRTYHIVNCDEFTRGFYADHGLEQPEAEEFPVDAALLRSQTLAKTGPKAEVHGKSMYFDKKYMEARLGKHMESRERLRKFLDNDRKVLRFEGEWDDTGSLYGDKNSYIITYFLADDTAEITQNTVVNSGKEQFPKLLSRCHLPKNFTEARAAGSYEDNKELYYHAEDFVIGKSISILGRDVLLRACDPFTRSYYEEVHGFTQPEPLVPDTTPPPAAEAVIPPPTGYGDHEDSLGSVYKLVPKPPKRDYNKLMEFDGEVYRFQARFVDPSPEDAIRKFVIQLYPQDDTLGISEPPVRNSGVLGGKFLARGKYRKADGSLYTVADFEVGGTIHINGFTFTIEGTDDFTRTRTGV